MTPLVDLAGAELDAYRPRIEEPAGLDAFWAATLSEARRRGGAARRAPYRPGLFPSVSVEELVFSGAEGHPIHAWLLLPTGTPGPFGCVVRFPGYGSGRGVPLDHLTWAAAGLAVLAMDARSQGGWGLPGATGDPAAGRSGPEHPGLMTRGAGRREDSYLVRLVTDAVRAVETAATLPEVDASRIGVSGRSQGGGLSLMAAALAGDAVSLCQADVPFLCHYARAVDVAADGPYLELTHFFRSRPERAADVLAVLAHVDAAVLAPRIRCRTTVSVGLMDDVCPASTVVAAYHRIAAPKRLVVHPHGDHDPPSQHAEDLLVEAVDALR